MPAGAVLPVVETVTAVDSRADHRLQALFNESPVAIGFSRDGVNVDANPRYVALFGYVSASELVGRPLLEQIAPRARDDVIENIALRRSGGHTPSDYETVGLRKDGTEFPMMAHVSRTVLPDGPLTIIFAEDLSERRRAEEQLEMMKHSIDINRDGAYWFDIENRFVYVNQAACQALGYACEELLGRSVGDVNPRATSAMLENVWAQLRSRRSFRAESIHRRKDGSEFPVELSSTHVAFGGAEYCCGFAYDISERKNAEKALREIEGQLRGITDNIADTILRTDRSGRISFVNKLQPGLTAQQVLASTVFDFVPPEQWPVINNALAAVFDRGETAHYESNGPGPGGAWRTYDVTVSPIHADGSILSAVFVARDVTERKEANERLQESERRLSDITFSMADWVWEVDARGVYTYSSLNCLELLGRTREAVIGRTMFDFMPPEEAQRVAAIFSEIAVAKAPIRDVEKGILRADGERICLLTNAVPMLDRAGNLRGYRGVDKDITDRKRAEDVKARLEDQLQQAQKMEAVGQLAGGVAHDFNNILAAIIMQVSMLRHEAAVPPDELNEALDFLLSTANRAANLTRQLLLFSRRQPMKVAIHDVNVIVAELTRLLQRVIGEDVTLTTNRYGEPLWIKGDAGMIEQVVTNLCVNARDSMCPCSAIMSSLNCSAIMSSLPGFGLVGA